MECQKKYRATEKGKEVRRNNQLKRYYGITIEDYDNMLDVQGGICKMCGTDVPGGPGRFAVDHNHATGVVRGLLCMGCNTKIGWYEINKVNILEYID